MKMCFKTLSISLYITVISAAIYSGSRRENHNLQSNVFSSRLNTYLMGSARTKYSSPNFSIENSKDNIFQNERSNSNQEEQTDFLSSARRKSYLMRTGRRGNRNLLLYQISSKTSLPWKPLLVKTIKSNNQNSRIGLKSSNDPLSTGRYSSMSSDADYLTEVSEYKRDSNLVNESSSKTENHVHGMTLNSEHKTGTVDSDQITFPHKDIMDKLQEMISEASNLNQLEDNKREETLPAAARRYANEKPRWASEEYYPTKWDLQNIQFTTISVGTLMLFLIMVVMVLALRVHCRNREKASQEWIRHPVVQPSTAASGGIQPSFKHLLNPEHFNSEPIRIKTKGLLERRGSNTSLTIDLGGENEAADVVISPSRECTPEDFLMTAGSRMNRRQLRQCLKDPRDLHTEFWQIPTNHPDKCIVPGAAAKNRYRTVLPNEKTRVVLYKAPLDSPETPASQYINSNYIRGYDGEEKAYIATQGPLANTVEDLWLLVLQERSPALIMITRLKEKGWVKCESYVPTYAATFGSIQVTVKQIVQKNGYTIRQIYIKRGDEVHTTLHFWFMSWPDHKTPSSARHLLAMATEVENARKECQRPVIVHCSAGIGRTGCFIALSIGRIQLLEEDCVDVLSIVCQMRLDRGGMVQTAEQYQFIHRALALFEATLPLTASSE